MKVNVTKVKTEKINNISKFLQEFEANQFLKKDKFSKLTEAQKEKAVDFLTEFKMYLFSE